MEGILRIIQQIFMEHQLCFEDVWERTYVSDGKTEAFRGRDSPGGGPRTGTRVFLTWIPHWMRGSPS